MKRFHKSLDIPYDLQDEMFLFNFAHSFK